MVEGTVSRLAQDLIRQKGVTLLINVKASVMDYVARLTQGFVLTSRDQVNPGVLCTCRELAAARQ